RRLCALVSLLLILGSTGNPANAQQTPASPAIKINIAASNTTLRSVLSELEKQSGYYFVYAPEDININRNITFSVKDVEFSKALDKLCTETGLTYIFSANYVTLKKREENVQVAGNSTPQQQPASILRGIVLDPDGEPIIGASLMEKGTTNGTITDIDGHFSLNLTTNQPLVVSFMGMKTREVTVKENTTIEVVLQEDAIQMNEIVIVGYGTQKKVNLTGAIATVNSEKLVQAHRPNLSSALTGNLPGIRTVQTSGRPGEDGASQLDIRGFGEALVIVDGVESS
ncbi:MAG: carboxypeptidase-like regulatory domain-containing protein, partial [Bacteroides sp.]|nr:carboxypeptidase-like regulatory domain-containing protein [Bacteroides sp.]